MIAIASTSTTTTTATATTATTTTTATSTTTQPKHISTQENDTQALLKSPINMAPSIHNNDTTTNKRASTALSYDSTDSQSTIKYNQLTTSNLHQNLVHKQHQQNTAANKINRTNTQEPTTPTSIKGSHSDTSDASHETAPSSIDNHSQLNGVVHKANVIRTSVDMDPLGKSQSNSSESTIKNTMKHQFPMAKGQASSSLSKPNIRRHTTSSIVMTRSTSLHAKLAPNCHNADKSDPTSQVIQGETTTQQANSGPLLNRIQSNRIESALVLSRHSISYDRPFSRTSTFPAFSSHQELPISTKNEIQRMRDSILMKRNLYKRRTTDDDRVLVGNKISEGHENFVMAYNMLTGIRVAVSRCSGIRKKLVDQDFYSTKKLSFNIDGSELTPSSKYDFKFKDYCPEVFRELRLLFGIDPADYLVSITGKYILSELGSPGKSGSFFYYSRDYRFIIKTIRHSEHRQLRRILRDYYDHVKDNPNTLISQFYGLHRVKMPIPGKGTRKVHFVVMNNLFPPHRDIHVKYDLKGSTWGRITRLDPNEDISKYTLKDLNFLERHDHIKFGPAKRNLFFKQLEADVKLLQKIKVMDYSLLLGIHDVKRGNSHDTGLSVFEPKSSDKTALINTNPRDLDREDLPTDVFPGRSKYVFYGHDGGIRATNEDNTPELEIYYLGIIDCLTYYNTKKRLETIWRSLSHPRLTISALPPSEYGNRFLDFIKKGTGIKKKRD